MLTTAILVSTMFSIFILLRQAPSSDILGVFPDRETEHDQQQIRERKLLWGALQDDVKHVTRVMYSTYFDTCAYQDELNPHSMKCEGFLGMHATAVDSLDTLLLLGLHEEYNRTREYLREHLDFDDVKEPISVFETTIRILGGLNSAYALSGDPIWRSKAVELAERFLPLFNESRSGCPRNQARIANSSWAQHGRYGEEIGGIGGTETSTADVGTLQLEMRSVSLFTGDPRFAQAADRCTESLLRAVEDLPSNRGGLPPPRFDVESGSFFGSEQTVAGLVDSFIEMLLKTWLASGRSPRDQPLVRLFDRIAPHVWNNLVKTSPTGITFVTNKYSTGRPTSNNMHHLSCFYPGSLALAALHGFGGGVHPPKHVDAVSISSTTNQSRALSASNQGEEHRNETGDDEYLEQARRLGRACHEMSRAGEHGIAAEMTTFLKSGPVAKLGVDFSWLRPEVVESIFYLDRVDTSAGDRYKEWGRQMWQSLRKHSQVPGRPDGLLGSWKGLRDAKAYPANEAIKLHESRSENGDEDDRFEGQDDDAADDLADDDVEDDDDHTDRNSVRHDVSDHAKIMRRRTLSGVVAANNGKNSSSTGLRNDGFRFNLTPDGKLHSFVIAETLKYFWLLFDARKGDDAPLPLTKWVFNTEAHPVPILNAYDRHTFPGSLYVPVRNKVEDAT